MRNRIHYGKNCYYIIKSNDMEVNTKCKDTVSTIIEPLMAEMKLKDKVFVDFKNLHKNIASGRCYTQCRTIELDYNLNNDKLKHVAIHELVHRKELDETGDTRHDSKFLYKLFSYCGKYNVPKFKSENINCYF
jgi:hypothetical protein